MASWNRYPLSIIMFRFSQVVHIFKYHISCILNSICIPPPCDVSHPQWALWPVSLSSVHTLPFLLPVHQCCMCAVFASCALSQVLEVNNGFQFTCDCGRGKLPPEDPETSNSFAKTLKRKWRSHKNRAYSLQEKENIVAMLESGVRNIEIVRKSNCPASWRRRRERDGRGWGYWWHQRIAWRF